MLKSPAGTLFVILAIAFVAPWLVAVVPRLRVPALVIEILLGLAVGPSVLNIVEVSEPIKLISELGLATLIFMAGFEIDPQRLRGRPATLSGLGWLVSVGVGLAVALVLQKAGVVRSELYVGFALTTTALGALVPIVRDAGLLSTNFGTHVMAIGSVGEFGPIIAVALVLSGTNPISSALALAAFAVVAVVAMLAASRLELPRLRAALAKTLRSSGQLHIRLMLLLVVAMAFVANQLGLDFLLGAFTAGVLYRMFVTSELKTADPEVAERLHEAVDTVESKLEAVAFGYLVPIFFIVTGIKFDLDALTTSASAMLKVPLFLALFVVVRGSAMVLYRREFPVGRDRVALTLLTATALPLVVVITTLGVEAGQMRESTAAALVGAGMLSIVVFPLIGIPLASRGATAETVEPVAADHA